MFEPHRAIRHIEYQWTPSASYDNQRKEHEAYAGSAAAYRTRTSSFRSQLHITQQLHTDRQNKTHLQRLRIDYSDSHQHINGSGSRQRSDQSSSATAPVTQQLVLTAARYISSSLHFSSLSTYSTCHATRPAEFTAEIRPVRFCVTI